MKAEDLKVLNRYALNDVAYWAQWIVDDSAKITISARYVGYDSQGTIYFRLFRFRNTQSSSSSPMQLAPLRSTAASAPHEMDVRIAVAIESDIASASWRSGPGDNDVVSTYYAIGKNGELLEVEPLERPTESRKIGFHQDSENQ